MPMDVNSFFNAERSKSSPIFKEGVKVKFLKTGCLFRILPAFDSADPNNMMGCLPFRVGTGGKSIVTNWFTVLFVSRFIGHGKGQDGGRRDILAMSTFSNSASDSCVCPISQLYSHVNNHPYWGYLTEDYVDPATKKVIEAKAIQRPARLIACNIIDVDKPAEGVFIGVLSTSAATSLAAYPEGLIHARNNIDAAIIEQNPMAEWAVGDLTHPITGPVLQLTLSSKTGEMAKYSVLQAVDITTNRIRTFPINPIELLRTRVDLSDNRNLVKNASIEDVVKSIIQVLNKKAPDGKLHEYDLIKEVFPEYRHLIPSYENSVNLRSETASVFKQESTPAAPTGIPSEAASAAASAGFSMGGSSTGDTNSIQGVPGVSGPNAGLLSRLREAHKAI